MKTRATSQSLMAIMLLILAPCLACHQNSSLMLPHELQGEWTTDDPRYAGRLLDLSPSFVILVRGHADSSVQWVDRVKSEQNDSDTTLTIYSTDRSIGEQYEMTLFFRPANGGEIRFRNQTGVWRRHID